MRVIKFRAKERSGEWHVGSLFVEDGMGIPYIVSGVNTHYETNYSTVEVVSETVGQFTGLKDCKGQEIFEGDIVRTDDWSTPSYIRWDVATASFVVDRWSVNLAHVDEIKVIGNVYDDPDLLEAYA